MLGVIFVVIRVLENYTLVSMGEAGRGGADGIIVYVVVSCAPVRYTMCCNRTNRSLFCYIRARGGGASL